MDLETEFTAEGVRFWGGQPALSGMPGDGTVQDFAIRDADSSAMPPQIRTTTGVTLFVSAVHRRQLQKFCNEHQIPLRHRYDVWADLLESFLDTDMPESEAAAVARLTQVGFTTAEIIQIRDRVAPSCSLQRLHWEWVYLGVSAPLEAASSPSLPPYIRFTDLERLRADLGWAMKIVDLARHA
jgi:enamine deaminase RidA (YjgF/YER057c/UK114 family)